MSGDEYFKNKLEHILTPMFNALLTATPEDPVRI